MIAEQSVADRSGSVAARVRKSQIEVLFQFPARVIGHLINGTLVVAVLWGELEGVLLLGWLALVVLVVAARFALAGTFRSRRDNTGLERWAIWFTVGSTVSAALWGLATAVILWLVPGVAFHVFIAFIIAGTCSAATTMTYAFLPALYTFLVVATGPLAVGFVMIGEGMYLAMAFMTALLVVLMMGQARAANATLLRALTLQEENRVLVQELSLARDSLESRVRERTAELDAANASLRQEMAARVETESRLQQAHKMEAIGQLTGGIAHDFNNLLAVIQGNAELLQEQLGPGGGRELQAIVRASARGAQLTQRLLAFSRKQALQPHAVDVNDLITGMTDMLGRTLGGLVHVDFRPDRNILPAHVDAGQLENAILNLAINARDAMPFGGTVTIATGMTYLSGEDALPASAAAGAPKPGRYVGVTVGDTGCGIAPENLGKVWEPFYTTKRAGEGTGLGLSMVYGFIMQSGGQVSIESEPGRGTSVRMCLPASSAAKADLQVEAMDTRGVPRGTEYVFVLEDDDEIREMLNVYLSRLGYRVVCAGTAEQAYEQLAEHGKPDLIVSDVVLRAGHRGPQIVAGARRSFGPVPAIFMSGHASGGVTDDERAGGEAMLVDKPFELADMARRIRAVLDGAGAR